MVQKTIRLYLFFTALTKFGISFISATYVMFLLARGLNLLEVNLVNLVFFTTLFLAEIPTGAVADVFGRKLSFVLSCFIFSLSMIVYTLSHSIWGFIIAEAIAAIGATFATGAFQAWLVDSLNYHNHDGPFLKIFAKEQQISQAAAIIGALSGAFVADIDISLPWAGAALILFIAGVLAVIFMKEDYFVRQKCSLKQGFAALRKTVTCSFHYGRKNKVICFIVAIGMVQLFALQAPNMQWQPLFAPFLPNKTALGFIFTGISIFLAIGARLAPRLVKMVPDEHKGLLFTQIGIGTAIILTALSTWLPAILGMFFVHEIGRGIFKPLKDMYLHDHVPSRERATLLSFESMAQHLGGMIGLVVSGVLAQYLSIVWSWVILGFSMILISVWFLINRKSSKKAD